MRHLRTVVAALSLLLLATPAVAKDLCFSDLVGNVWVIQGVKHLRNPGKTFPVKGYAILVGNTHVTPLSGTAAMRTDGKVLYGVTAHNLLEGKHQHVAGSWNPVIGIVATHYDTDGDGSANSSGQWNPIDCKSVVIP